MFLTKTTTTIRGKTYTHYKVVESVREGGRVKHRVLFSLGALSEEQAQRIRAALAVGRGTDWVSAPFADIVVTKHAAYLDIAVGHTLWHAWDWDAFWGPDAFWVEALVLNRLMEPQAKIHVQSWVADTVLPAYYGVTPNTLDPYAVYRVLDHMAEREADVHQRLAARLLTSPAEASPTFFYDLTSTYVDGTTSSLAKPGYSRDHRPDRTQIVIGLLITATGDPVYWQVWPGNTPDVSTVQTVVADLQARLGVGPCTLVFDRGMVSAANLAAIESAHQTYLSALDRDELAGLPFWATAWPEAATEETWQDAVHRREMVPYDGEQTLWFREFTASGRRWVLAFDHTRFQLEWAVQAAAIAAVQAWVNQKNTELAAARRTRQAAPLERTLQDLLQRKHLRGIVQYTLTPITVQAPSPRGSRAVASFQVTIRVDEAARRVAQRLFGVTCFQTNALADQLSAEAVITWYRRKNRVEEAFHEIKSPLALRPLFVSRAERIRAHVMTCVLAYLLYNDMEERLRRQGRAESPVTVLNALRSGQINRLRVRSTDQTRLSLTEPSALQRTYVTALGCEMVLADRAVQSVVEVMQDWL